MTNIEPQAACNDFCIVPVRKTRKSGDSGVLMVAGEQSRIMSFYTPQLGVAPHWCSFLDSLTEGLEESVTQGKAAKHGLLGALTAASQMCSVITSS